MNFRQLWNEVTTGIVCCGVTFEPSKVQQHFEKVHMQCCVWPLDNDLVLPTPSVDFNQWKMGVDARPYPYHCSRCVCPNGPPLATGSTRIRYFQTFSSYKHHMNSSHSGDMGPLSKRRIRKAAAASSPVGSAPAASDPAGSAPVRSVPAPVVVAAATRVVPVVSPAAASVVSSAAAASASPPAPVAASTTRRAGHPIVVDGCAALLRQGFDGSRVEIASRILYYLQEFRLLPNCPAEDLDAIQLLRVRIYTMRMTKPDWQYLKEKLQLQ